MDDIRSKLNKNYIKNLKDEQGELFCAQLRNHIIEKVLQNGGHLASNLGVVELTVALHKVFDFPKDKIVFDVGHQSYVHKMLSGRFDEFDNLRKLGGLSGFPKTSESEYDSFNTGHASTSISAALGMARARDIANDDFNVIAFIGDGSLGGGMAFEALNDVGDSKTKLIIVLNDNEMSINRNVGGLSAHLSKLRATKGYIKLKSKVAFFFNHTGRFGKVIVKTLKKIKKSIAFMTLSSPMFEELGITYLGIIDGHDIDELTEVFEKAKNMPGPVIIHAQTQKGKGYEPAEMNPGLYHGVSVSQRNNSKITYTKVFGQHITAKAEKSEFVTITAAMADGCGLNEFSARFPHRFRDVGIAEQHAVTLAAGYAISGIVPVFAVYSTFLQRGYDQILHDVCLQNLHVVFALDRAGIVGEDGETHQGIFDLSYLSHLPNMTILAPTCSKELEQMLDYAVDKCAGPVCIRYPKSEAIERSCEDFQICKPEIVKNDGKEIIFLSVGRMLEPSLNASEILTSRGISSTVVNIRTVKPLDAQYIESLIDDAKLVVTVEDNIVSGGAGQYISSSVDRRYRSRFIHFGFGDEFVYQGSQNELFSIHGLTGEKIAEKIMKELSTDE